MPVFTISVCFSIWLFCYLKYTCLSQMKLSVLQLACAVSIAYENETDPGSEIFSKDKFCGIEVGRFEITKYHKNAKRH